MPKGPLITDEVRRLITKIYVEHTDWQAKEVQSELNHLLNSKWPGLSAVQKALTKIRKKDDERSPESKELDGPWSTASMVRYPIPPEALPSVLKAWACAREKYNHPFTIREALWAARLYAVTKDDVSTLVVLSRLKSLTEVIEEIDRILMVSSETDLELLSVVTGQNITPERRKKYLRFYQEGGPLMYRPQNWTEILLRHTRRRLDGDDRLTPTQRCCAEGGADAMLKSLEPLIRKVAPSSRLVDILYPKNGGKE
tara:strand:+ start:470 stop:1234 length:765 start_codon:yes stop_codon:yes gene_type:complete